jgi:hypothetical protein
VPVAPVVIVKVATVALAVVPDDAVVFSLFRPESDHVPVTPDEATTVRAAVSPLPPVTESTVETAELSAAESVGFEEEIDAVAALAETAVKPPSVNAIAAITATFFKDVFVDICFLSISRTTDYP